MRTFAPGLKQLSQRAIDHRNNEPFQRVARRVQCLAEYCWASQLEKVERVKQLSSNKVAQM